MSVSVQEMRCEECGGERWLKVTLQMSKHKNPRAMFRVDCDRCGGFSHYLNGYPFDRAVEEYLRDRVSSSTVEQRPYKPQVAGSTPA